MTRATRISCENLLSQISSYLDGDLPELTCAAIEEHAMSCTKCEELIADFRTATGLCRSAATAPLPDAVRARASARVRELISKKVDRNDP